VRAPPHDSLEPRRLGITAIKPVVREAPEVPVGVECHGVDAVGRLGRGDRIDGELRAGRRLPVSLQGRSLWIFDETGHSGAVGPDPEPSLAVFRDGSDPGNDETVADTVIGEAVTVEACQAVVGPEPQVALAVLVDGADQAPAEAFGHAVVAEGELLGPRRDGRGQ